MHYNNVAVAEKYHGLHQWNFEVRDGAYYIWKPDLTINLSELLSPYADIETAADEQRHKAVITKKAASPLFDDPHKQFFREAFFDKMLDYMYADVKRKLTFTERLKRKLTGEKW